MILQGQNQCMGTVAWTRLLSWLYLDDAEVQTAKCAGKWWHCCTVVLVVRASYHILLSYLCLDVAKVGDAACTCLLWYHTYTLLYVCVFVVFFSFFLSFRSFSWFFNVFFNVFCLFLDVFPVDVLGLLSLLDHGTCLSLILSKKEIIRSLDVLDDLSESKVRRLVLRFAQTTRWMTQQSRKSGLSLEWHTLTKCAGRLMRVQRSFLIA